MLTSDAEGFAVLFSVVQQVALIALEDGFANLAGLVDAAFECPADEVG